MVDLGIEKWPLCMAEAKKFVAELKMVKNKITNLEKVLELLS